MKQFILRNNLNLMALLGVGVAVYLALFWPEMPVMQRTVGLFFIALVLHVWEEMRYPGGFPEMMMSRLDFAIPNMNAAHALVSGYVLYLVFVPFFFPHIVWLAMASMVSWSAGGDSAHRRDQALPVQTLLLAGAGHCHGSTPAHRDLRHHLRRAARPDPAVAMGVLSSLYGDRLCHRTRERGPDERIKVTVNFCARSVPLSLASRRNSSHDRNSILESTYEATRSYRS